jgi:hypothetical protein
MEKTYEITLYPDVSKDYQKLFRTITDKLIEKRLSYSVDPNEISESSPLHVYIRSFLEEDPFKSFYALDEENMQDLFHNQLERIAQSQEKSEITS